MSISSSGSTLEAVALRPAPALAGDFLALAGDILPLDLPISAALLRDGEAVDFVLGFLLGTPSSDESGTAAVAA